MVLVIARALLALYVIGCLAILAGRASKSLPNEVNADNAGIAILLYPLLLLTSDGRKKLASMVKGKNDVE